MEFHDKNVASNSRKSWALCRGDLLITMTYFLLFYFFISSNRKRTIVVNTVNIKLRLEKQS